MNVKALIKPVAVLAAVFVLLLAFSAGLAPTAAENAAAEQARLFDTLLPGGNRRPWRSSTPGCSTGWPTPAPAPGRTRRT